MALNRAASNRENEIAIALDAGTKGSSICITAKPQYSDMGRIVNEMSLIMPQ